MNLDNGINLNHEKVQSMPKIMRIITLSGTNRLPKDPVQFVVIPCFNQNLP